MRLQSRRRALSVAAWSALALLFTACGESPERAERGGFAAQEAPEEEAVLFAGGGEEITAEMQASLDQHDPAADGWRSEVLHDQAKAVLSAFVHALIAHRPESALPVVLSSEFETSTVLRPARKLELAFDDGVTTVHRATEISTEAHPRERLQELVEDLVGVFEHEDLHAKAKIFRTDLDEDDPTRFTVENLVILNGPAADGGLLQVNMIWTSGFVVVGDDARVELRSVALQEYEEVRTTSELFGELTLEVFADVPRFEKELLVGAGDYHFRTDRLNGNVFGGSIGMAVGDVNGDGLDDVYVCQHGGLPNRLFVRRPDGTVKDWSEESGIAFLDKTQSALFLDVDNDGDQDALLSRRNAVVLAVNDGTGRFTLPRRPLVAGSDEITSLSAADYDGDGDLDIYACMYAKVGPLGTTPVPYQDATNGPPNVLWRNDGGFEFTDVTAAVGLDHNNVKFTYAAIWEDFDGDGDPDLYVVNDFGRNNLYRNDDGRFRDVAVDAGADDMAAGMGVTVADFDLDGDPDLYTTNMWSSAGQRIVPQSELFMDGRKETLHGQFLRHARGNTLLANNGDGTFTDATVGSGAANGGWAWGAKALDVNNDGRPDIYSPNGFLTGNKADDL